VRLEAARRNVALLVLGIGCVAAQAQLTDVDPDWKEAEAPPPPALKTEQLVPLEISSSVLRWGVDPASIRIGNDGVVRYVVVARGEGGAVNALYEGVRCNTAEVKLYARNSGDKWVPVRDADWKPLHGSASTLHSLAIARNGACVGRGANRSPDQIARDLGSSGNYRFRNEVR
jgi:CNP1-like family